MRSIALFAALILAPGMAFAGSITTAAGMVDPDGSILAIGCPSCTDAAKKPETPTLAPGHEIVRIERVDGKVKVYRTSNWLGGSPVTYVREASEADLATLKRQGINIASADAQTLAPASLGMAKTGIVARDGIDRRAKTGSVSAAKAFDPVGLQLRLGVIEASE